MNKLSVMLATVLGLLLGTSAQAETQASNRVDSSDDVMSAIILEQLAKNKQILILPNGTIKIKKSLINTLVERNIINEFGGGDGTDSDTSGPKGGGGFDK